MREPRNICATPDGLIIRIQRKGVIYQATVPKSHPNPMMRAIELRDRFIKLAGPAPRTRQSRRSNTGITGISEGTKWSHNCRYPMFQASAAVPRRQIRCFTVSRYGSRRQALRAAAAWRSRLTGERISSDQIMEALNHV